MLDELLIGGEISETSKKNVLKAIAAQDMLQEVSVYYMWPTEQPQISLISLALECLVIDLISTTCVIY